MKVIGRPRLLDFIKLNMDAKSTLQAWMREIEGASWRSSQEVKGRYYSARIERDVVVFYVKDNLYYVKTQVNLAAQVLLIMEVGMHLELNLGAEHGQKIQGRDQ